MDSTDPGLSQIPFRFREYLDRGQIFLVLFEEYLLSLIDGLSSEVCPQLLLLIFPPYDIDLNIKRDINQNK
jgi:hypothetical protein